MKYEGDDCLYFDVRRGAEWINPTLWGHQLFTEVAFGNMVVNEQQLHLKVMATGSVKDYDRPFVVVVNADSTTAKAGEDFTGLQEQYIIKAGEISTDVNLTIHRTPRMTDDTLTLQLMIKPNEHFQLPYHEFGDYPGVYGPDVNKAFDQNKDAAVHNLFFHDVLTRPKGWYGNDVSGTGLFGKFSAKKYRLMMKMTNTTVKDYTQERMPSARATAIAQKMAIYVLDQAKKKTPVLDEDGTMMYFMPVSSLGGSAAWDPFTLPKDYYKE